MTAAERESDVAAEKETGRMEAFSDGVFAIAITLLVLDIHVPDKAGAEAPGSSLLTALWDERLVFLAFVASFFTIGVMWINHHRVIGHLRRTDNTLLVLNLLLLLAITVVPFPTRMLAEYGAPASESAVPLTPEIAAIIQANQVQAAVIYNGTFLMIALLFNLLWFYIARHPGLLAYSPVPQAPQGGGLITRRYRFGPLLYSVALVLAFVSVPASLALNILLAVFFALPVPDRPRTS